MQTTVRVFTYTARRGAYLSTVAMVGSLMLLECGVVAFFIVALVRNPLWKLALLAALELVYIALVLGFMLAPLWTRHRLTETHLQLRYGIDRLDVPRIALVAARPVQERVDGLRTIRAYNDTHKRRIVAVFSDQGQLLLRLDRPHTFKVNGSSAAAETILINVDDREALLNALALPAACQDIPPNALLSLNEPAAAAPHGSAITVRNRSHVMTLPSNAEAHHAIRAIGLTGGYGERIAVDHLDLVIRPGEIYGFLGPNGAGKTTTIKMRVGLLQPSAGVCSIAGHDMWQEPNQAKALLGYVPDRALLYERLTGREFLSFLAQLRGIPRPETEERINDLLGMLQLDEQADSLSGTYSFGMKRKLALAGTLLHRPPVLILDEPLNGLDPRSARRLKDLFASLAARGGAIMLSMHDLATAEAVCHRVGIINRGRLVVEGSGADLRELAAAPDLETVFLSLTGEAAEVAV